MSFFRACFGLLIGGFLAAVLIGAIGQVLFGVLSNIVVISVAIFLWLFYYKNYLFKQKVGGELAKTLIGRRLSDYLIDVSRFAPVLIGAGDFGWRVVHSDDFAENFDAILKEYEGRDGETVESNPLNPNAVAVTWFGYVMGYLAKTESAELFAFILKRGGMARCQATMKFDIADNASAVRVDVQKPFRFQP